MFQRLCHTRIGRQLTELWCWGRTSCTFIWMNSEGQLVLTARALCGLVHMSFSCLFNFISLTWGQGGTWLLESFGSGSLEVRLADGNRVFFLWLKLGHPSICTNQVGSDAMEQDLEANLEPCCMKDWTEWKVLTRQELVRRSWADGAPQASMLAWMQSIEFDPYDMWIHMTHAVMVSVAVIYLYRLQYQWRTVLNRRDIKEVKGPFRGPLKDDKMISFCGFRVYTVKLQDGDAPPRSETAAAARGSPEDLISFSLFFYNMYNMYSVHIPGLFARIELGRCSISIELRKMFLFQFWHTSTTSVIPVPCHFQSRVLTQTLMSEARKLGHYKIQRWRSWGAMTVSVVEELGEGNFRMDQIVAKHFFL